MRIKNIYGDRSMKGIAFTFFMCVFCVILFVAMYYFSYRVHPSFLDFCSWYWQTINSGNDIYANWFIYVIAPFIFLLLFIATVYAKIKAERIFNKSLNLVSLDFLPDRVCFNFNRPQCNFACGYSDVKKLELVLGTAIVRTNKGTSTYPIISNIGLNIEVLNNKTFSLTNSPAFPMRTVYKIIDYGRSVQNFSYKYSGVGKIDVFDEKILDYINTGCKQILATRSEDEFKTHSVCWFGFGLVFLAWAKFIFGDDSISLVLQFPALLFFVISFVFDIVLLADKWNERRFKRF